MKGPERTRVCLRFGSALIHSAGRVEPGKRPRKPAFVSRYRGAVFKGHRSGSLHSSPLSLTAACSDGCDFRDTSDSCDSLGAQPVRTAIRWRNGGEDCRNGPTPPSRSALTVLLLMTSCSLDQSRPNNPPGLARCAVADHRARRRRHEPAMLRELRKELFDRVRIAQPVRTRTIDGSHVDSVSLVCPDQPASQIFSVPQLGRNIARIENAHCFTEVPIHQSQGIGHGLGRNLFGGQISEQGQDASNARGLFGGLGRKTRILANAASSCCASSTRL